nr:hypothetical protein [Tanacetum cinerariifolium]
MQRELQEPQEELAIQVVQQVQQEYDAQGPGSDKETRIKSTKRERVKMVKGLTSRRNLPWVGKGPGSDKETHTKCTCSTVGWHRLKISRVYGDTNRTRKEAKKKERSREQSFKKELKTNYCGGGFKSRGLVSLKSENHEPGGASGSGGCGDDEEGADHQDDEDEDGDGDT